MWGLLTLGMPCAGWMGCCIGFGWIITGSSFGSALTTGDEGVAAVVIEIGWALIELL